MLDELTETRSERLEDVAAATASGDGAAANPSEPSSEMEPRANGGVDPFLVVGLALAAGIVLARWIAWRGRVHRRT